MPLLALLIILWSGLSFAPQGDASPALEVSRYRFQKYAGQGFERLVLEFKEAKSGTKIPRIKTESASKEATVHVQNAMLVGVIPESAILASYLSKSKILGPVSIDTYTPTSFKVHASLKNSEGQVDAFWLHNPSRLVIDAFRSQSARAKGPALTKILAKKTKLRPDYFCFPAGSKIEASQPSSDATSVMISKQGQTPSTDSPSKEIHCFHRSALMQTIVNIEEKPASEVITSPLDSPASIAPDENLAKRTADPGNKAPSPTPPTKTDGTTQETTTPESPTGMPQTPAQSETTSNTPPTEGVDNSSAAPSNKAPEMDNNSNAPSKAPELLPTSDL